MLSYLQPLVPILKYDRFDYLQMLKSLLPRGPIWKQMWIEENVLRPLGILSTESFGIPNLGVTDTWLYPDGIVSGELFGNHLLGKGILPQGIVSSEIIPNPSLIPGWISIYDNFDTGTYNPVPNPGGAYWNSDFETDWSLVDIGGDYIAIRGSDGDDRLTPANIGYDGDFSLELGYYVDPAQAGNTSLHLRILRYSDDALITDLNLYNGMLRFNSNSARHNVGTGITRGKLERVSGIISAYWWSGSAWVKQDSWDVPGSSLSNSDEYYIEVNGAEDNGFSYFDFGMENVITH